MSGELPVLAVDQMTKRFSGTLALDAVTLSLEAGKIHALLGENGAGKSTLIKVLAGVHRPDGGVMRWRGEPADPVTRRLPISFIHQDLGLVDQMTIAENIALTSGYPRSRGMINWRLTNARAVEALEAAGSRIDPTLKASEISPADRSIVAIARALASESDVLVLDEPTAALSADDVDMLLGILDRLRARGKAILYVTHRLDEVFRIADTVTVLRDGRKILTTAVNDVTPDMLVASIVGRPLESVFIRHTPRSGKPVLSLRNLRAASAGPVDLDIAAGEVVAVVGLRGSGHDAVGRSIYGDIPVRNGDIQLDGESYLPLDPAVATRRGVGLVASKRHEESLALNLTVRENAFFHPVVVAKHCGVLIRPAAERANTYSVLDRYSVRPREPERLISTLSGGNQQKVVVARWLESDVKLLILEEPTIGVDVGAKSEIYSLLQGALDQGLGVLLVSSDFEEVVGIANRAVVFDRGRVVAQLTQNELSISALTALAGGHASTADPAKGDPAPPIESHERVPPRHFTQVA